ncbi:hypothetical protein [Chryseobacterium tongliaoense]|uniref:hypothetical protein n=1 Tax=Chryseobacterium tongliaoense TaxID=3240933 RepID=UPI003515FD5E
MKKIAYIEIDTHAEIARAFMDIMHDSREFTVDYYFSKKIRDQIREDQEAVFLSDSSMITDQLKNKDYDMVIIGTVHRYFNTFLAITQKYNTAVIVHNLNFPQTSKWGLIKSIFKEDVIYRLKLWWKEGLFYVSKPYKQAKNLMVLDPELSSDTYKFLPLFYTGNFEKKEDNELIVVIPGSVSQKRRDYQYIFNMIRNSSVSEPYSFIFLGKAQNRELKELEKLSENVPENITVKYFTERVSSDDFEHWMSKADVLWCPVQQQTEFFSQPEIYGVTKMTGNLGDAIKYGKIAVFPKNYPSKSEFIIPETENIIEQFKTVKNTAFDFNEKFSKTAVLANLEQVLNSL